jgi:hypothetical protein
MKGFELLGAGPATGSAASVANEEAAETWFKKNDPEGVAFEYDVNPNT